MSEIAVIIPAHCPTQKEFDWLLEAIRSVHGQSFNNYEVIVVFDGSPIVGRQDEAPPWLRMLNSQPQRGPSHARNLGVRASTSPWIVCLDADDRFKSNALHELYANRHEVLYVYGDLEYIGDRQGTKHLNDFNLDELRKIVGPAGVTALFHRRVFDAVGGWREDLDGFEDIDFWLRCAEIGIYGRHINSVIFEYRQHPSSRTARIADHRQAIRDQIRANHMPFIEGGRLMSNYQQQPPQPVTLKYEGAAQASFLTPASPITSKQYNVEGRGGYINVDARDVAWLLSFRSGPMAGFRQIDNAPVTNFNLTAAASQPGTVREAKPVPNLNDMTAKEAIAAIEDTDELSDLLVMKAMEQAKQPDMVRKTVIQAIEKRVDQLQRPAEEETLDASEQDG
jgi:hypothetical protein